MAQEDDSEKKKKNSNNRTTPLLADEHAPTSLVSPYDDGHYDDEDNGRHQTEFSKLLSRVPTTTTAAAMLPMNSTYEEEEVVHDASIGVRRRRTRTTGSNYQHRSSPYVVTIATTTFCILHLGFLWAAFVSETWADTTMVLLMPSSSLFGNNHSQRFITVASTSLATILRQLDSVATGGVGCAVLIWITSLLLPCFFAVLSPSWIVSYFRQQQTRTTTTGTAGVPSNQKRSSWGGGRAILELSIRFAWMVVFVVALFALVTQYVKLEFGGPDNNDDVVDDDDDMIGSSSSRRVRKNDGFVWNLHNSAQPGLVSFALAVTCAVTTIALLRLQMDGSRTTKPDDNDPSAPSSPSLESSSSRHSTSEDNNEHSSTMAPSSSTSILRSPPWHAFSRHPGLNSSGGGGDSLHSGGGNEGDSDSPQQTDDKEEDVQEAPSMRILEEETMSADRRADGEGGEVEQASAPGGRQEQGDGGGERPLSAADHEGDGHRASGRRRRRQQQPPSFFQMLLVFQIGLLSILLWMPALLLPLARFEYRGVAAALMPSKTYTVKLGDIPLLLFRDLLAAKTASWMVGILTVTLFVPLVLAPVALTILAWATWMSGNQHRRRTFRRWMYAWGPVNAHVVLALSLCVVLPTLESWSEYVFNNWDNNKDGSSSDGRYANLCSALESITGALCLTVTGTSMRGLLFYLAQVFFLEMFVLLTLYWS